MRRNQREVALSSALRDNPVSLSSWEQFHLRFKFRFTHFRRMSLIRPASFSALCFESLGLIIEGASGSCRRGPHSANSALVDVFFTKNWVKATSCLPDMSSILNAPIAQTSCLNLIFELGTNYSLLFF